MEVHGTETVKIRTLNYKGRSNKGGVKARINNRISQRKYIIAKVTSNNGINASATVGDKETLKGEDNRRLFKNSYT